MTDADGEAVLLTLDLDQPLVEHLLTARDSYRECSESCDFLAGAFAEGVTPHTEQLAAAISDVLILERFGGRFHLLCLAARLGVLEQIPERAHYAGPE